MGMPHPSRVKDNVRGEVAALSRIDRYALFQQSVQWGNKITVTVHVLCPRSYHFDIVRKEQRQCFDCIWEGRSRKGETRMGLPRNPAEH